MTISKYLCSTINVLNLDKFWFSKDTSGTFVPFSGEHLMALAIVFSLIILLFIFKQLVQKKHVLISRILGTIMLVQSTLVQFWYYERGLYTPVESLPLYLCRISIILCGIMLFTQSYKIFEVVYFWGLGAAFIAILNPDIGGYVFPHWMYLQFFIGHGGIIVCIIFMMIAYGYRPYLSSLINSVKWCAAYLVITYFVNVSFDANYSYLMAKPAGQTILDVLPAHPYYVPLMLFGMFVFFCLLYVPYIIKDKSQGKALLKQ